MFLRKKNALNFLRIVPLAFLAVFASSCSKSDSVQKSETKMASTFIHDVPQEKNAKAVAGEFVLESSSSTRQSEAQNAFLASSTTSSVQKSAENPEYKKLEAVLSKMSPRFKSIVHIEDKDAFLLDLAAVLKEETSFRRDDLSLYYLIDKKHSVSADYVPKDLVPVKQNDLFNVSRNDLSLRPDVYDALCEMSQGALKDGIKLMVSSTYRSYSYQERLFARYVAEDGEALAERYSARPGTSQHQLGVAVDFGSITDDFADTKQGKWLASHCEDYGWSLSFPKEYEDVTGFMWECWHFRYIGKTACQFQNKWFSDVQQFMIEFIDAWKNA